MSLYVTFDDVRHRLTGKVRFTEDDADEDKMHRRLAARLINEAEGRVELDLSPRYAAPFQTDADGPFKDLPERPTKEIIRTLCELMSCIHILETDFGKGSAVDAAKYTKSLKARYKEIKDDLLAKKTDAGVESAGFRKPPLPGLKLNYMNATADDGFHGSVLIASGSEAHGNAAGQINSPGETFWRGLPWP